MILVFVISEIESATNITVSILVPNIESTKDSLTEHFY